MAGNTIPEAVMSKIVRAVAHARPEVDAIFALVQREIPEQTLMVGRILVTLTHRQVDVVPDWRTIATAPMPPERVLWVVDKLSVYPRGRLLDVGCGRGQVAAALLDDNWEVQAFDVAPHSVADAQSMGVPAVVRSVADWDWNGRWDLVLSTAVVEHLPREQHEFIRAMRRAAGRLCLLADIDTVSSLHTQPDLVALLGTPSACCPAEPWPSSYRWMVWE